MDKFIKTLLTIQTAVIVLLVVAVFWLAWSKSGLSIPSETSLDKIKSSETQKRAPSKTSLTAAEDDSLHSIDEAIELLKNTPEIQEIWQKEYAEKIHCSAEEQELTNSLAYGFGFEIKQPIDEDTDSLLTIKRKISLFECKKYSQYDLYTIFLDAEGALYDEDFFDECKIDEDSVAFIGFAYGVLEQNKLLKSKGKYYHLASTCFDEVYNHEKLDDKTIVKYFEDRNLEPIPLGIVIAADSKKVYV